MAQIFHRSFNVISKASIFGALLFIALMAWVGAEIHRSSYSTNAHVAVEQPIPFSHEHHVRGLGIDCRYCHTSVEESAVAGIPPTKTCMNCHSQIWVGSPMLEPVRASYRTNIPIEWVRVHNLGDFVNFNHSIHVKKGFGCSTCHGRVDRMPLTWQENTLHMEWCLDCHRNPERYIRPKEEVFSMDYEFPANQEEFGRELVKQYNVNNYTSCSICHH